MRVPSICSSIYIVWKKTSLRKRMESGKLEATFRDLYYLSTAKEKSWQKAHRIKDTKIETGDTRNIVTKEDYEKTLAKARERMKQLG